MVWRVRSAHFGLDNETSSIRGQKLKISKGIKYRGKKRRTRLKGERVGGARDRDDAGPQGRGGDTPERQQGACAIGDGGHGVNRKTRRKKDEKFSKINRV